MIRSGTAAIGCVKVVTWWLPCEEDWLCPTWSGLESACAVPEYSNCKAIDKVSWIVVKVSVSFSLDETSVCTGSVETLVCVAMVVSHLDSASVEEEAEVGCVAVGSEVD